MSTEVLAAPGFLARERTIAGPGFSRWLIPPAALAIHLCIGMAYGFSVFWLPLSKAFGISIHQLWLLWLGSGVIGGIGLGLGYISPVSTLVKWFPDRRGMATGMAI